MIALPESAEVVVFAAYNLVSILQHIYLLFSYTGRQNIEEASLIYPLALDALAAALLSFALTGALFRFEK